MQDDTELRELKELVQENIELTQRNNRMLRKMKAAMNRAAIARIIYWVIILGTMLGIYYYLQPVFETFTERYEALVALPDKIKEFSLPIELSPGN
jgi:hypothetical protein